MKRAFHLAVLLIFSSCGIARGQNRPNPANRIPQNACGPIDPSYIRIANESGGQPLFFQPSEVGKSFEVVTNSTRNNSETIVWSTGTLNQTDQTLTFPVDSVTSRLTLIVSADAPGSKVRLIPPSGLAVSAGEVNAKVTDWNCGHIATVTDPPPGIWRVSISGTGRFWVRAQAESDIYFVSVEFVKTGGRPGHEGLFKIPGQPLATSPATLRVTISSAHVNTAEFSLVSEHGEEIQKLQMNDTNSDHDDRELLGTFDLPRQPFRVAVTGRDSSDTPFQRFFHSLFHAETVEVIPGTDSVELTRGEVSTIPFTIRNIGPPGAFHILATDSHGLVKATKPKELVLETGEARTVTVSVTAPDTPTAVSDDLVVTATGATGSPTTNSAVVHLPVPALSGR